MTLSNLACDTKYTRHKVAEVSAEVTPTRAAAGQSLIQERPGYAWALMCGYLLCAPVSKAMKLMREDKLEMEGNKQHMGGETDGKMIYK